MTTPADAGLHIAAGMTTPSRPGKQPRPVWTVTGNLAPWSSMLRDLGGRKYGRGFSFWTDPTDAMIRALQTTAPDSYTDQLAAKQDRSAARADRHSEWAEKADTRSQAAYRCAHAAVDGIPPGQPILVGHHSERRHRAALTRHDTKMRRAVEEQHTAEYHRGRAHAAARTASDEHTPAFCQRRITETDATIRDIDRRIARTHDPSRADLHGTEGAGRYRARLEQAKAEAIDKREYWRARLAEAGGIRFSRDTIAPGDEVRPRSHGWARVVRCNPTTVSVQWEAGPLANLTGKYPYAEITDHRRDLPAHRETGHDHAQHG